MTSLSSPDDGLTADIGGSSMSSSASCCRTSPDRLNADIDSQFSADNIVREHDSPDGCSSSSIESSSRTSPDHELITDIALQESFRIEQKYASHDKDASVESEVVSKRISCMICDKTFITQSKLKQHLPYHTGDKPFQCDQCDMRFPYASSLRNHRMAHLGDRLFECSQCEKKFTSKSGLRGHVRVHNGVKSQPSKTFSVVDNPSTYQQSHASNDLVTSPASNDREGIAAFRCLHCDKCFAESSRLKKHMYYHDRAKPFTCEQCGKSFAALDVLLQHVERQHSTEKIHQCENCDKRFANRSSLKYHRMTHRMRFSCDLCGRRFSRSQRLKTHLALHESKKVYEYDLDDGVPDIAHCLENPLPSGASEKPYGCELCDKKFAHLRELDWHRVIHAGENKFECMLCNKKFPKSSKLKRHFLVHTGEKPYSCEECSKRFATSSDLKRHQRRRCCGPLHKCPLCDSAFTQPEHLDVHMETHGHYGGEPQPAPADSTDLVAGTAAFPDAVHCPSCGVKFEDAVSREEHSCCHLGEDHVHCAYGHISANPFLTAEARV